jgi:hypothetical protein
MTDSSDRPNAPAILGLSVLGAFITGIAGLIVFVLAVLNADFVGAGVGLVASALAFGLLANAVFRQ